MFYQAPFSLFNFICYQFEALSLVGISVSPAVSNQNFATLKRQFSLLELVEINLSPQNGWLFIFQSKNQNISFRKSPFLFNNCYI
jgi:hypothetical protein